MSSIPPSELVLLVCGGVLIASIPLVLVWMARGQDRLRRLAWVAAFLTFDLVVFGGFTRLTDSGLGCPDWPGCFAHASPLSAAPAIDTAARILPSGPVTMTKAWIEMIHRTLAGALSIVVVVMAFAVWRQRRRPGRHVATIVAAVVVIGIQVAFGALTVTHRLQPAIVTTHLLLGLALLALLVWHAEQFATADVPPYPVTGGLMRDATGSTGLAWLARIAALALAVQIALGGWVSSNYAVLACSDFPLCQGKLLPPLDLANGFTLWRDLGRTASEEYLPFAALTAIHFVHRSVAWVVAGLLLTLAWRIAHLPGLARAARWLGLLVLAQFLSGIANVLWSWPLAAGVLHNAGAAALVVTLTVINYAFHAARPKAGAALDPPLAVATESPR